VQDANYHRPLCASFMGLLTSVRRMLASIALLMKSTTSRASCLDIDSTLPCWDSFWNVKTRNWCKLPLIKHFAFFSILGQVSVRSRLKHAKMSSRKPTMRCPKYSILCHQRLRPPTTTHKNSSQFWGSQPGVHAPLGVRLLICRGTFKVSSRRKNYIFILFTSKYFCAYQ